MQIKCKSMVKGRYNIQVVRPNGSVKIELEFDNLVTDFGLNLMGATVDYLRGCHVGSGSSPPSINDTALEVLVATANGLSGGTYDTYGSAQASPPYYIRRVVTFEFGEGAAEGNLSEVGVGLVSTSGGYLFSRALILDGAGDPTTITVLSDEILRVTYELRLYPPDADVSGSADISGASYNFTSRAANVTNFDSNQGWAMLTAGTTGARHHSQSYFRAYEDGTSLGDVYSQPSGSSDNAQHGTETIEYVDQSLEVSISKMFPVDEANFEGGIGAFLVNIGWGTYQIAVTPSIPKTSFDELTVEFIHSWGRYNSV